MPLWQGALALSALWLFISAFAGLFLGLAAALLIFTVGLLAYLTHHLLHLQRLQRWIDGPLDAPLPEGRGAWDDIFGGLHRRTRIRLQEKEALAAAVERFRRAGEALPDGVVILAEHDSIDAMNARAALHLGLNAQADRGQTVTNLVRDPDFVAYLQAGQFEEPLVYHSSRVDGLTLLVQVIDYGNQQRLLLTRDITQLERLETMRRDFVANVSHELKTPLTVVSGFVEMLHDNHGDFSAGDTLHFLSLIREQSARMQRLIEDLLTLSALETTNTLTNERVAVAPLLQSVLGEAQALSNGRHDITLNLASAADLQGCATELRSAFGNLASNAVRYTPAGGSIALSWRNDANGGAVFAVSDTGIGIAQQHIPRLTERFYRVDRGRSRETGGTGLGLAIVKHVLTRHQATLEVSSEPGKGSCFAACFPPPRLLALADNSSQAA